MTKAATTSVRLWHTLHPNVLFRRQQGDRKAGLLGTYCCMLQGSPAWAGVQLQVSSERKSATHLEETLRRRRGNPAELIGGIVCVRSIQADEIEDIGGFTANLKRHATLEAEVSEYAQIHVPVTGGD